MIVVGLSGGLGNQMFQYAAGRALALRHRTGLKLDLSRYAALPEGDTPREYQLHRLHIAAGIAASPDLERVGVPEARWRRLFGLARGDRGLTLFREEPNRFNRAFLRLPDNSYLSGYWQSERYFRDIAALIRSEFRPSGAWSRENLALADAIAATTSVSLHVRRGDYVSDEKTRLAHGACTLDYYAAAVDAIRKKVASPHFYLFSDDPGWVADNIRTGCRTTVVAHNGSADAVFDLALMSLCRHHIIANSTFSWWGAWLNGSEAKIVVAPSRWFAEKKARDLVPASWIKV